MFEQQSYAHFNIQVLQYKKKTEDLEVDYADLKSKYDFEKRVRSKGQKAARGEGCMAWFLALLAEGLTS